MNQSDQGILKTISIVMLVLVAIAVFVGVAAFQIGDSSSDANEAYRQAQVEERIRPIGEVSRKGDPMPEGESAPAMAAASGPKTGKEIVAASCASCHGSGVMGAPKLDDTAAWNARLANGGVDGLVARGIAGIGGMPARGGNAGLSDDDMRNAVVAMLQSAGIAVAGAAPVAAAPAAAPAVTPAPVAAPAPPAAAAAANPAQGLQVYNQACAACHAIGVAGAPKVGDKADWAPRIAKGAEALLNNAISGFQGAKGYMPPKGGAMHLSDSQVADAVTHMVNKSK